MILWLNGTFGVGKTTTANAICDHADGWRLFDPEWVGYMLRANLRDREIDDFQDIEPWRSLVPRTMHEIAGLTGDRLVAVQTVLVEQYWRELRRHSESLGLRVFHVVLDCRIDELRRRIEQDDVERDAREWRIDHIPAASSARSWMTDAADLVIDTTDVPPEHVASAILDGLP